MNQLKHPYSLFEGPEYDIPFDSFFQCALSVDCVVFGYLEGDVKILLIERGAEPFLGNWALPGDLMYPKETLEQAAVRVLKSLTGIDNLYMEHSGIFSSIDRHPQGRVITSSYFSLVNVEDYAPQASSWASTVAWHSLKDIPELAFDHRAILEEAILSLRKAIKIRPIGFELLPEKFTLNDIQRLYELILDRSFDRANFRKKILGTSFLKPLDELQTDVSHRPAKLYRLAENINESPLLFL